MQEKDLFLIDPKVTAAISGIRVGVAVIHGVKVAKEHPGLESAKQDVIAELRENLGGTVIADLPRVRAVRRVYRKLGVDPHQRRPSAEALLRRALDPTKRLPIINTVVDAYSLSSLEYQLPVAAYDLDLISPPISLRFSGPGEVLRSADEMDQKLIVDREPVCADQNAILYRCFDSTEKNTAAVSIATKNLIVVVDGWAGVEFGDLYEALEGAAMRIVTFNGGTISSLNVCGIP